MKMTARSFLFVPVLLSAVLVAACDDSGSDGAGGAGGESANGGGDSLGGGTASGGTASGGTASGGSTNSGTGCSGLCEDAGYSGGSEEDYGEVIECLCEGAGDDIEQTACSEYCMEFGVPASASYLSSQNDDGATDKCVCDGTVL